MLMEKFMLTVMNMSASDVDVAHVDPVVEAVAVDVLLDCFTGIEAAAWIAIEALGAADCDPAASTSSCGSLQDIVDTLSECRLYCEQMSAVMASLLGSGEGLVLSPADAEDIEVVEGVVRDLVDAGGLCHACRDSERVDG